MRYVRSHSCEWPNPGGERAKVIPPKERVNPRGNLPSLIPTVASGVTAPENKSSLSALSSISKRAGARCRSPSYERFLEGCRSPLMRLAERVTALRAWCKQCPPGSVKTGRAPSWHGGDARVYGHATTAMHKLSTPPPPPLRPLLWP